MNIHFNSIANYTGFFLQKNILPSLNSYQKRMTLIVLAIFSGITVCLLFTRYYFNAKKTPAQLSALQDQSLPLHHSPQASHKLEREAKKTQTTEAVTLIQNSQEPLKASLQSDNQQDNISISHQKNNEPQVDNKKVDKGTQTEVSLPSPTNKETTCSSLPPISPQLTSLQSPVSDNQQSHHRKELSSNEMIRIISRVWSGGDSVNEATLQKFEGMVNAFRDHIENLNEPTPTIRLTDTFGKAHFQYLPEFWQFVCYLVLKGEIFAYEKTLRQHSSLRIHLQENTASILRPDAYYDYKKLTHSS